MAEMISAIIPVFNTPSEFLQECITSLISQTYTDSEILIVDDGSRLETAHLCDSLAQQDPRIRVIHQDNKGPSMARNTGLKEVRGEYITFVDSDDSLKPETWEYCIRSMNETSSDCAVFGWIDHSHEMAQNIFVSHNGTTLLSAENATTIIASDNEACGGGYPWNKVWRAKSIREANCGEIPLFDDSLFAYEDKEWILRVLQGLSTIVLLPEIFYDYRYVPSSLSNAADSWYRRQYNAYAAYDKILKLLKDKNYVAYRGALNFYFYFCFMDLFTQYRHPDWFGGKERCRKTKECLYDLCRRTRFLDLNGYKRKIIWLIMQIWGVF